MSRTSLFSFVFLRHCSAQIVPLTLFALTVDTVTVTVTCFWCTALKYPFTCCAHSFSPPCGMCFYVTALGFSMMATVMTVNPLGNDLSSCLHSSCTAPPCPGGHAAAGSISPASSSECYPVMTDWMCVEAKGSFCLSSIVPLFLWNWTQALLDSVFLVILWLTLLTVVLKIPVSLMVGSYPFSPTTWNVLLKHGKVHIEPLTLSSQNKMKELYAFFPPADVKLVGCGPHEQ